jgi:acetylornithine/N-succinyldiaminopimelate aminotransferase
MNSEDIKHGEAASICRTYARYPLAVSRGEGCTLFTPEGRPYTDLLAGIAVCNLGHSHPELVEVICGQAKKLIHVSNLFYQEEQVALARRLLDTSHLKRVFFCNSGAEANEGAIKLARRYMREGRGEERFEIITLSGSFHGRTLATLTATGQDKIKTGFGPLPEGFITVPFGDLAAMENAMTGRTALVLVEMIQGEGGVKPLPAEYAKGLAALCAEKGVLLAIDEIQTGVGPHRQVLGASASRPDARHRHRGQRPGRRAAHGRGHVHRRGVQGFSSGQPWHDVWRQRAHFRRGGQGHRDHRT